METVARVCARYSQYKDVIIFGASGYGGLAHKCIKDSVNIVAFCDNDKNKRGTFFNGIKTISPEDLDKYEDCAILIASSFKSEISKQLYEMGIDRFFSFYGYILNQDDEAFMYVHYQIEEPMNVGALDEVVISEEKRRENVSDFTKLLRDDAEKPPFSISTGRINYHEEKGKNVLIIASGFPPHGGAGVQRTLKYVKYLKKNGYNPIVIAWGKYSEKVARLTTDESLLGDIPSDTSVIRVDYTYAWWEKCPLYDIVERCQIIDGIIGNDEIMKGFLEDLRNFNKEEHRLGAFFTPWPANALRILEDTVDFSKIGVLYSSAPVYENHFIGFYIKSKYGIPWVADYRDEWATNPLNDKIYKIERLIEGGIVKKADAFVMLNDLVKESYCKIFEVPREKVFCIANGYDEDDFAHAKATIREGDSARTFTIRYGGVIYYTLDPFREFIEVMNELAEEGAIDSERIEVIVTGNNEKRVGILIKDLDKNRVFSMRPNISHGEIISRMMSADVILLFGRMGKSTYTGKIFEYIRMGVPIFAVGDGEGAADELIAKTKTGVFFDRKDKDGMKKAMKQMYDDFFGEGIAYNPNYDEIKKYSREYLTERLIDVFDYVLNID